MDLPQSRIAVPNPAQGQLQGIDVARQARRLVDVDDLLLEQLRQMLVEVSDSLRSGSSFTDALIPHQHHFPSYYLGILRSAELTGNMDLVLNQLAAYMERDIEAKVPDTTTEVVLYCGGGFRSALAADALQKMGYTNVLSMDGGIRDWRARGYPLTNV